MAEKTKPVSLASLLGLTPEKLNKHAGLAQWLAIVFIVLGIVAIVIPGPFSLGIELFLGWLLLIGGVLQAVAGFSSMGAKGWWVQLLSGIISAIVGALFLMNPFEAVEILTMLLAAVFLTNGIFRIVYSLQASGAPGAGLAALNGLFGIIVGVIVWAEWPTSAVWFLGLLVGIDLLFLGMSLFAIASAAKKEAKG